MKAHVIIYLTNKNDLQDLKQTFDNLCKNMVSSIYIEVKNLIQSEPPERQFIQTQIEHIKHEYATMNSFNPFQY